MLDGVELERRGLCIMPSNAYGFDFLANQHRSVEGETNGGYKAHEKSYHVPAVNFNPTGVEAQSDLEKQFIILAFLKEHREACIPPSLIYRATGVDLEGRDIDVANMLASNHKIRTEVIPDPENPSLGITHYAYQSKYPSVRDKSTLLAQVNRMPSGVRHRDLADSYPGIEEDINSLITAGEVIACQNTEERDKVLFPRGDSFLVELDGGISIPAATNGAQVFSVSTDVDPRVQIRRGEAIQVAGQWFRVSSAIKEGVSLSDQPTRAQAPLSVVSRRDLSDRNEADGYIRDFSKDSIPLDHMLEKETITRILASRVDGTGKSSVGTYAQGPNQPKKSINKRKHSSNTESAKPVLALRHGCTKDVRDMYLETRSSVPESDHELKQLLVKHKLLESGEKMRRDRLKVQTNVDTTGKTKKRRYYIFKNQRITNTHLQGTEIGSVLAIATEKQKMGKSVGDGGM